MEKVELPPAVSVAIGLPIDEGLAVAEVALPKFVVHGPPCWPNEVVTLRQRRLALAHQAQIIQLTTVPPTQAMGDHEALGTANGKRRT